MPIIVLLLLLCQVAEAFKETDIYFEFQGIKEGNAISKYLFGPRLKIKTGERGYGCVCG
jgi:hypothetical protein